MGNSEARTNDKIKKKKIMESIEIEDKIKKEKDNIDKCQKNYENIFWGKIKKVPRKTRIKIKLLLCNYSFIILFQNYQLQIKKLLLEL